MFLPRNKKKQNLTDAVSYNLEGGTEESNTDLKQQDTTTWFII